MDKDGITSGLVKYRFKKGSRYSMSEDHKEKIRTSLTGNKSYLWKGGYPKCKDCGKLLTSYKAKRCRMCFLLRCDKNFYVTYCFLSMFEFSL